jgi:hypothetical protein
MLYIRTKLREGLARIARENPSVDFSISTPEVNKAEDELNESCASWGRFEIPVSGVQKCFKVYEAELLKANGIR